MKPKAFFFLFITLLGFVHQAGGQNIVSIVSTNTPVCKYSVVNFDNGVTFSLLATSTTTLTFRVEWQPGLPIPCEWLDLMVKQNLADEDWNFLSYVFVTPEQGYEEYSIFIDEDTSLWHYTDGWRIPQLFFKIRVPTQEDWDFGPSEIDKEIAREGQERFDREVREHVEAEARKLREAPMRMEAEENVQEDETMPEAVTVSPPSRLWLYAVIALALCAVFYFVRKKFSKTP